MIDVEVAGEIQLHVIGVDDDARASAHIERDIPSGTTVSKRKPSTCSEDTLIGESCVEGKDDVFGVRRCATTSAAGLPVVVVVGS